MAVIGIRYPIWSPYVSGGEGAAIVYGEAVTTDEIIEANVSWTRNTNVLYASDRAVETDNSITSGKITLNLDDVSPALATSMLGMIGAGSPVTYEDADVAGPHGGFGYIRVKRKKGVTSFEAYWIHDCQFVLTEETSVTRGENIEWQTPKLEGTIFGTDLDGSGIFKFRKMQVFATEALAKTYLDSLA